MKKSYLFLVGACVVFLLLFVFMYNQRKPLTHCGDGFCDFEENCINCSKDCGCSANEYCTWMGTCREHVCGDKICSEEEQRLQNCCKDCGCPDEEICNEYINACQERAKISEEVVERIVKIYMNEKQISGDIVSIRDSYYGAKIVKEVLIDCGSKEILSCLLTIRVNEEGQIIGEP